MSEVLPGFSLRSHLVANDIGDAVQDGGYYQHDQDYRDDLKFCQNQCGAMIIVSSQAPTTKSSWSITKRGAPRFRPMLRLKNAATMSPSIAPRERARRMGSCSNPVPKDGRPIIGAIWFCRSPTRMPQLFPREFLEKSCRRPGCAIPVLEGLPHVQGHASAEERCAVIRYIGGQHQPESNNQDIQSSYSDRSSRFSHISNYLMEGQRLIEEHETTIRQPGRHLFEQEILRP